MVGWLGEVQQQQQVGVQGAAGVEEAGPGPARQGTAGITASQCSSSPRLGRLFPTGWLLHQQQQQEGTAVTSCQVVQLSRAGGRSAVG